MGFLVEKSSPDGHYCNLKWPHPSDRRHKFSPLNNLSCFDCCNEMWNNTQSPFIFLTVFYLIHKLYNFFKTLKGWIFSPILQSSSSQKDQISLNLHPILILSFPPLNIPIILMWCEINFNWTGTRKTKIFIKAPPHIYFLLRIFLCLNWEPVFTGGIIIHS